MPIKPKSKHRLYGSPAPPPRGSGYVREKSRSEYQTYRWHKASRLFREEHPLCAECFRKGIITASKVTDHIIPVPVCDDFWDSGNWQALCESCHNKKAGKDKKTVQNSKRTR
ncbi:HNH endonuclease [Bacteroidales bacterium Barb6XT]|nr:HNH endonuclease [Bacteroidales bacterium Barb6XT]